MPKEDLNCSSAEVYGSPLTVPGDFIATPQGMYDSATILPQLRDTVSKFAPIPTTHHGGHRTFIPSDLQSSEYIFIHRDGYRTPLQHPYEGPFHVLERNPKFFMIDFGGKPDTVSVDHLKLAHLDISHPVQVAKPRRWGRPPTKSHTRQRWFWGGDSCGGMHHLPRTI